MKDLKVSSETHSLLFSLKNKLILSHNKKFTYDEVLKLIISQFSLSNAELNKAIGNMYQLEEKP